MGCYPDLSNHLLGRATMTTFQSRLSFLVMTILVFIVLHVFLFNSSSSGPNTDISLSWLELHRHGDNWTIGDFHPIGLIVVVFVAALVTWILSKILRHQAAQQSGLSP